MAKKRTIAMLLAGGQGSRLGILTYNTAKPAVPFGGKYRIIDFPLSNCSNSNIDTVGVLTQYEPLELNSYIGNGAPWDLDRINGGVYVLPPYMDTSGGVWYKGTANAIYQNINFIQQFDPEYVVVLSGDHIYKMNYEKMVSAHQKSNSDCTISVMEVPIEEASRFGIMNTDSTMQVVDFEEKPKNPKSNLASMGVYVFSWNVLKHYLILDEQNENSSNDFGKNIIPQMLADNLKLMAYTFEGYWKDVGTIDSLWEAHMDLLADPPEFNLYDESWKIYSRNPASPPHYIGENVTIHNSIVTEGCKVYGEVHKSVLFHDVVLKENSKIYDSVIMPNVIIQENTIVHRAIIGEDVIVGKNVVIGAEGDAICLVGKGTILPDDFIVQPGQQIDEKAVTEYIKLQNQEYS